MKRALISVFDKTGIVDFAKFLVDNNFEIISTGGTKKLLESKGLEVVSVSSITGIDAIMDGRVKTLNPKIFGGILAQKNNSSHINDLNLIEGKMIDLVVVNFYPFLEEAKEKKLDFDKAIEFIDIGGPSMLRAAAKNYEHVIPLCDISQYSQYIEAYNKNKGVIDTETRRKFSAKIFKITSQYDSIIYSYLNNNNEEVPSDLNLNLSLKQRLRYGENPHQESGFYLSKSSELPWTQHQGKELSYNNFSDMESAINIVSEFEEPCCCIIKHNNPCGFSLGSSLVEAFNSAILSDPISYFGGIVGFNKSVDKEVASSLVNPFLECIIAPSFSKEALEILSSKKNLRVIQLQNNKSDNMSFRSVFNGFLIQSKDSNQNEFENLEIVTDLKPNTEQLKAMNLGWILVRYIKSNAIALSNSNQLLGVGAGQMSRIDALKIALRKVHESSLNLDNSILASDAFFPFPDCVEMAAGNGIRAIIQPGGSINDQAIIDEANSKNIIMAFTKVRHFLH